MRLTDEESTQLPQQQPFRTYRIWPVPLDWTQETLEHELQQFKITDLAFIARHPCKGGTKFLYRGRATDLELAVLEHSAGAIQILMQRQSQRQAHATPVRPGRGAFSSTAAKSERPAPNPVQPTAAATDSQSTPGRERPPAQHAPAKRQAVAAPAAPTFTLPEGLARKSNPGQGDCLFFALEQALGTNKLALRASVCAHLRRHDAHYKSLWTCLAPAKEDTPMTDWEEYLTALAKPGAWTSLLEIHAAAKHLPCLRRFAIVPVKLVHP